MYLANPSGVSFSTKHSHGLYADGSQAIGTTASTCRFVDRSSYLGRLRSLACILHPIVASRRTLRRDNIRDKMSNPIYMRTSALRPEGWSTMSQFCIAPKRRSSCPKQGNIDVNAAIAIRFPSLLMGCCASRAVHSERFRPMFLLTRKRNCSTASRRHAHDSN